jgi:Tfp pilus assembly protein PilF
LVISQPGKDKAHAALLRALILIENKNYETADQFLQNILSIDCQNIDAWELSIRANLQRVGFYLVIGQDFFKNRE